MENHIATTVINQHISNFESIDIDITKEVIIVSGDDVGVNAK